MKPRKLRRLNFDSIQTEMSVIGEEHLRSIVGGYANDCFWRCIAYIESGGTDFSESAAARYADSYFGSEAGLYYRGAAISNDEMREYISNRYSENSNFNLIQFDPSKVPSSAQHSTLSHIVVPIKDIKDQNGNVIAIEVFDPQHSSSYEIPIESVIDVLGIRNSDSSSNYGSSSN